MIKNIPKKAWNMVRTIVRDFIDDDCLTHSASISFYFLLSFIPFLIILSAFIGYGVEYAQEIYAVSREDMARQVFLAVETTLPFLSEQNLLEFFTISKYKFSLGTIGTIALLLSSTLLFTSLQYAFYKIMGGKFNYIYTRLMGMVFVVLLTVLVFFMHYAYVLFFSLVESLKGFVPWLLPIVNYVQGSHGLVSFIGSTILFIVLFFMMFAFLTRKVYAAKRSIALGAILFSVLWNLAKWCFTLYLGEISKISVVYGSLAWLIIVILWIYYSSLVLLLSMEFIKYFNSRKLS